MAGRGLWVALLTLAAGAPARGYPAGRDSLDDYNTAIVLYNQGIVCANHGELTRALEWFRRARHRTRRLAAGRYRAAHR